MLFRQALSARQLNYIPAFVICLNCSMLLQLLSTVLVCVPAILKQNKYLIVADGFFNWILIPSPGWELEGGDWFECKEGSIRKKSAWKNESVTEGLLWVWVCVGLYVWWWLELERNHALKPIASWWHWKSVKLKCLGLPGSPSLGWLTLCVMPWELRDFDWGMVWPWGDANGQKYYGGDGDGKYGRRWRAGQSWEMQGSLSCIIFAFQLLYLRPSTWSVDLVLAAASKC